MQRYTPKEQEMLKLFYENQSSVATQNSRYWGTENPLIIHEHSIRPKVTVEFFRRKSSDRTFLKTMTAKRFPSMV